MNIRDEIEAKILLQNNKPIDDFLGLTPNEVHYLLHDTYSDKSPIHFKNEIDNNTLDKIPLFRLAEEYLKILQRDKQIKLTPLGALPKKVLVELYDKRILLEELIESKISKLSREHIWTSLHSARLTLEVAGFVKKRSGKLTLTKNATKILETNSRSQLFKQFFQTFTDKFYWSFNDGYTEEPVGQFGWAFSLILLDKFGNKPTTTDFYAKKYLTAFPMFITFFEPRYDTAENFFFHCYGVRTFQRFFLWFGFVLIEKQNKFINLENDKFEQTDIVKKIFEIDE